MQMEDLWREKTEGSDYTHYVDIFLIVACDLSKNVSVLFYDSYPYSISSSWKVMKLSLH